MRIIYLIIILICVLGTIAAYFGKLSTKGVWVLIILWLIEIAYLIYYKKITNKKIFF